MLFDKKKTAILLMLLAVFLLAFDRFLKNLALQTPGDHPILGDILQFSFAKNYYIAFSIPIGGTILLVLIFLIIIGLSIYSLKIYRAGERVQASLFFLVLMGAISNLCDRLSYGYVIDYLDLKYFTVFNVADVMIVVPVFSILLFQYTVSRKK